MILQDDVPHYLWFGWFVGSSKQVSESKNNGAYTFVIELKLSYLQDVCVSQALSTVIP
jgi:hypothetical protein